MKNWINKNFKTLIITAFLIPIITVAVVSISHVTTWYGISNPITWSVYLSIGIEIAALSALAAISANMGSKIYFPFFVVTLIQFIGNIFFAYSYIDINSQTFKEWVNLVSPLLEFMGVESTDNIGHKRFLALFSGGMLPIISLSFLHMLVNFTEEEKKKENTIPEVLPNEVVSEISRARFTDEELKRIEEFLSKTYSSTDTTIEEKSTIDPIISTTPETIEENIIPEKQEEVVDNQIEPTGEVINEPAIEEHSEEIIVEPTPLITEDIKSETVRVEQEKTEPMINSSDEMSIEPTPTIEEMTKEEITNPNESVEKKN